MCWPPHLRVVLTMLGVHFFFLFCVRLFRPGSNTKWSCIFVCLRLSLCSLTTPLFLTLGANIFCSISQIAHHSFSSVKQYCLHQSLNTHTVSQAERVTRRLPQKRVLGIFATAGNLQLHFDSVSYLFGNEKASYYLKALQKCPSTLIWT